MFKDKLFNYLTKYLFNTIDVDDILRVDSVGRVFLRGKQIDPAKLDALKENAKAFKESGLWRFMKDQIKYEANKIIYDSSKTIEDTRFGKAMLLDLEVIERFLDTLSNLK